MTLSDTTNLSVPSSRSTMDERKRSIQPDSDDIYPSKRHQTSQNAPQMRMDSEKEKDVEVMPLSHLCAFTCLLPANTHINSRSKRMPFSVR